MSSSGSRRTFIKTAGGFAAAGAFAAVGANRASAAAPSDDPVPPPTPEIVLIPFLPVFTLLLPTYEYINWSDFVPSAVGSMTVVASNAGGSAAYPTSGTYLVGSLPVPNDATLASVDVLAAGTGNVGASVWLKDMRTNKYVGDNYIMTTTKNNPTGSFSITPAPDPLPKISNYHTLELWVSGLGSGSAPQLSGAKVGFYPDKQGYTPISPTRVYDSRKPEPLPGTITSGQTRTISVASGRNIDTGAVTTTNLVPEGAYCITYNLTIANTVAQGFLGVYPKAGSLKASAINWSSGGQVLANGGVVTLGGDREITIEAGGGGTTDFVVDITGYYI